MYTFYRYYIKNRITIYDITHDISKAENERLCVLFLVLLDSFIKDFLFLDHDTI